MDTRTLYKLVWELPAPSGALVKVLSYTEGFGDVEGEERYFMLRILDATGTLTYNTTTFTSSDPELCEALGVELSCSLMDLILLLSSTPSIRLPKLRALLE